jgi:hypothetical protein
MFEITWNVDSSAKRGLVVEDRLEGGWQGFECAWKCNFRAPYPGGT